MYRTYTSSDLLSELGRLQRQFQRYATTTSSIRGERRTDFPAMHIGGTPDSVEIYAFVPGLDPKSIDVTIERGVLTVSGERKSGLASENRGEAVQINERFAGKFRRAATSKSTNAKEHTMIDKNMGKEQPADAGDEAVSVPPADVLEDASGITLYADLPGVPKDKLCIRVESDTLSIDGEVPFPRYGRTFTLGKELDRDKVAADFRQGVLRLHIPKVEHVKPRKIEVQVA